MDASKTFLVVLLSLVALFTAVKAVCNSSATLGDPDPNDDVVTVKYDSVMAQINLKENYPVEPEPYIRIAVFNCEEADTPTISSFTIGTNDSLGLDTEHNGTKWYLIVKKAQDYESTAPRQYRFIGIAGSSSFGVSLTIINVDDVSPLFAWQNSTTCEIKEKEIGQSSCFLLVKDQDAIMDNMKFRALEGGKESVNISLVAVAVNDTDLCEPATPRDCTTVAIHINAELEFISKPVYLLTLEVEDQGGNIGNLSYVVQVVAEDKEAPHFTPQNLTVEIDEETQGIIKTNGVNIKVSDRDALDYGQFYITVEGNGSDTCYEAFDVIPNAGYRDTEVKLSVIDPEKLDYDEGSCNDIIVKIKATEINNDSQAGEVELNIRLTDINDELPEFEKEEYEFDAVENTPVGTYLFSVEATDRDVFDHVNYTLTGTTFLTVDPFNGSVMVKGELNYERQQQIFATVTAADGWPHFVYAQIVVNVVDVNDEKPSLVVWNLPSVKENTTLGTVLDANITASDPDTNPDLSFSIDWNNSRAAKQGRPVQKEEFNECLKIDTVADPENQNGVKAVLIVNGEIDWEVFDTLYLNVVVEDKNTLPAYEENRISLTAMLTVQINDTNDCAPEFSDIPQLKFAENSVEDKVFEVISATDRDGPGFNNVTFRLLNEYDGKEYVKIDPLSGQIKTGKDEIDFEKNETLYYTIVASDGELETSIDITIEIEDTNDNIPYFVGDYSSPIYIQENQTEEYDLIQIKAKDDDSSPEFNTLRYFVEDKYKGTFEIDTNSGHLYVPEGAGTNLDYERQNTFAIQITVKDYCQSEDCTFEKGSPNSTTVTIQLTDMNDNPPVFTQERFSFTIPEDTGKPGYPLGSVDATDKDSDINANLTFSFVDFNPEEGQDLFSITKDGLQKASIKVERDLLNRWGEYKLTVMASDIGNLTDTAEITILVTDVNNNEPEFVFPNETTVLIFNIAGNKLNDVLTDITGMDMKFSAVDDIDQGLNGTDGMNYTIIGDETANNYLKMDNDTLCLKTNFTEDMEKIFTLELQACDGEFESAKLCTKNKTVVRMRLNNEHEPTFDKLEWGTNFTENTTGMSEVRKIDVPVTDLNNQEDCQDMGDDCLLDNIYYFIYGEGEEIFNLESETGELSLKRELDREEKDEYTLVVVVTNYPEGWHTAPEYNSTLNITITVVDVKDTPPQFSKTLFAAGINFGDTIGYVLTTITAVDKDVEDELTYEIVADSMNVTDSSLQNLMKKKPFKITEDKLQLAVDVEDDSLRGIFRFDVQVTDSENFTDKASCQVYIISQDNFVSMVFQNNESFVKSKKDQIAEIYTDVFKRQSNVRKISSVQNSDDRTEVTSYFVDETKHQPVNKDDITKELTNKQTYNALVDKLMNEKLILSGISESTDDSAVNNVEGVLQTVLIVVSVVLGTLVVVLFAAFFIRTRSLNRRLDALSTTKFGSQNSGLNRIGLTVPNTNVHAVEGSNPIWGKEELVDRNFDKVSVSSGDSDLIGVEDNPEFSQYGKSGLTNDGFTPEFATAPRMSINPMLASGLNPFSAAALQESPAVGGSVNPLAGMQNSDDYDSENDSRRNSYNDIGQNNNFTFFGRMDSMPTTEL